MVESAGQEEMARTKSLYDTLLANAASLEPADDTYPVGNTRNGNCVDWHVLMDHLGILENPSLRQAQRAITNIHAISRPSGIADAIRPNAQNPSISVMESGC